MAHESTLFDGQRMTFPETIELVVESLLAHAPGYRRWALSWSLGKDSTFLLTLLIALLRQRNPGRCRLLLGKRGRLGCATRAGP